MGHIWIEMGMEWAVSNRTRLRGNIKSALTACLGAWAISTPVAAATWVYTTDTTTGGVVYIDADSRSRTGETRRAWFRFDYSKDKTEKARESKQLWSFECTGNRMSLISYSDYFADGRVIE